MPSAAGTKSRNAAHAEPHEQRADDPLGHPVADRGAGQRPRRLAHGWPSGGSGLGGHRVHPPSPRGAVRSRATMERVMPQQVPFVAAEDMPEDAVVLDVREDDEWVHGHIDGATHIPDGRRPGPARRAARTATRSTSPAAAAAARPGWRPGSTSNGFDAVVVAGGMGELGGPRPPHGQRDRPGALRPLSRAPAERPGPAGRHVIPSLTLARHAVPHHLLCPIVMAASPIGSPCSQ